MTHAVVPRSVHDFYRTVGGFVAFERALRAERTRRWRDAMRCDGCGIPWRRHDPLRLAACGITAGPVTRVAYETAMLPEADFQPTLLRQRARTHGNLSPGGRGTRDYVVYANQTGRTNVPTEAEILEHGIALTDLSANYFSLPGPMRRELRLWWQEDRQMALRDLLRPARPAR